MRFTSRKDMIAGLSLASGLLCFQLGAFFGADPPSRFYDDLMAPSPPAPRVAPGKVAPAIATQERHDATALRPIIASFIDRPAEIQAVRLKEDGARTRVEITLGPGSAAPRLTMRTSHRQPTLAVTDLNVAGPQRGDGLGLVKRWELANADGDARLSLPLSAPALVQRAFLTNESDGQRRLVLDLVRACRVPS